MRIKWWVFRATIVGRPLQVVAEVRAEIGASQVARPPTLQQQQRRRG
jgi:hypothetical protein